MFFCHNSPSRGCAPVRLSVNVSSCHDNAQVEGLSKPSHTDRERLSVEKNLRPNFYAHADVWEKQAHVGQKRWGTFRPAQTSAKYSCRTVGTSATSKLSLASLSTTNHDLKHSSATPLVEVFLGHSPPALHVRLLSPIALFPSLLPPSSVADKQHDWPAVQRAQRIPRVRGTRTGHSSTKAWLVRACSQSLPPPPPPPRLPLHAPLAPAFERHCSLGDGPQLLALARPLPVHSSPVHGLVVTVRAENHKNIY